MNKDEREKRIKEIKDRIFSIEVGYDIIPPKVKEEWRGLYQELNQLKKEAEECQM